MTTARIGTTQALPSMDCPAMEVERLSFRYHTREEQGRMWTLDRVSFHIDAGEILGIVGPNGSGKSSLLKVCAGLLPAGEGQVRLSGVPLGKQSQSNIARKVAAEQGRAVQIDGLWGLAFGNGVNSQPPTPQAKP